jgi:hypothetical protein
MRTGELERHAPGGVIWEPCAGKGAIVRELVAGGFAVVAHDLVAYNGADHGIETKIDFLMERAPPAGARLIVTNPPFKLADHFIRHGLALGLPVIALLRLAAIEGSGRADLVDCALRRIWAGMERLPMMHRDGWRGPRNAAGGQPFAWFVFEPGARQGPIEVSRITWRGAP